MMDRQELNRKISLWLGIKPTVSWQALNADESASCCSFGSKAEGDAWLAEQIRKGYKGAAYHIGAWYTYPDFFEDWSANAKIREKLREIYPYLAVVYNRSPALGIEFEASGVDVKHNFAVTYFTTDEREAWAMAALRVIDAA